MIVIGVDVRKHSLSAVAVDEVGRQLDCVETSDPAELVSWSKRVGRRRLWALEDCRHVTRGLERRLQRERQRLVRVPPRLTAPERAAGPGARQVGSDRRARRRPCCFARAAARLAQAAGGSAARVEAAGRPPRRTRRRTTPLSAAAALAPPRARPGAAGAARGARPHRLARPAQPPARPPRADDPGADRTRAARSLPQPDPLGPRARPRAARRDDSDRAAATRAARLRWPHGRQAALRDRAGRPLPLGRPARPPRRCRSPRGQLRQTQAPPPRPRRHRQLNCALHRIAVTQGRVHPAARAYLERKQAEGKTRREALRCLKRQLARTVYTTLKSEPLLT